MKKTRTALHTLLTATTIGLSAAAAGAFAQNTDSSGYLKDQRGESVRDPYSLCWRTGFWTPAMATCDCDKDIAQNCTPPAKVALTPPPAPVPPPAPMAPLAPAVKPVAEKVTLSADTLFHFDKASLRPEGRQELDALTEKLKTVNVDSIIDIGYTDRFGSVAYNLKLSVRRAESVRDYLVSKGVPANLIYVEGKGKSNPITKPGECKGPATKRVIACLQPDRRVEVEVVGTRSK